MPQKFSLQLLKLSPWLLLLLWFYLIGCTPRIYLWPTGKTIDPQPSASASDPASLANPAAVYCQQNNGRIVIRQTTQGEAGYCVFSDFSACEEWSYYRNQCKPGDLPNFE